MNVWVSRKRKLGFTIVELLIVVVVIGILAAISLIAYTNVQDKARTSVLQTDLASAKKKLMMYKVNQGKFPADTAQLTATDFGASKTAYDTTGNNFYYCYNLISDQFAMGARTAGAKIAYLVTANGSVQLVPGGVSGDTVCQAIGLTGWNDPNGWISNGYTSGTGWLSWVD